MADSMNPQREAIIEFLMLHPNMAGGEGPDGHYTREQAEEQADFLERSTPLRQPEGVSKILTTRDLMAANQRSRMRGYNRNLGSDTLARLDPDGFHFLESAFMHDHADQKPTEPHVRVKWLLKMRNRTEPRDALIDMTVEDYGRLTMMRKLTTGEWERLDPTTARELLVDQIARES